MCTQSPYEHIKALLGKQMNEFVRQWNAEGIIYENDFGISSVMLEHDGDAIIQVLKDAGCEITEISTTATDMDQEGWMYAGFDPSRYEYKEVEEMIRRKFGQKDS